MDDGVPLLPEEIIRNILKRLPVKSLIRFQCVCREWRILFKTQSFIADHLDHSNHQNPCLLFRPDDIDDPSNLYCLDSEMQVWKFQNPPSLDYWKRVKIIGSSNGLLCVKMKKHDLPPHFLLLWNPAIREARLVPETNFHKGYHSYIIGFGFIPIINDYKIVITYISGLYDDVSAVKVYSLSSGSWKEVKFRLNDAVRLIYTSVTVTVNVNGVMFWLGLKRVGEDAYYDDDDDDEYVIVSFDLAMEVFSVIPTPELHPLTELTVYEEKLTILCWIKNSGHSAFDLWVLEEDVGASRERWSWTKKYTSGPNPCCLHPRTIWRNEIVCYPHGNDISTAVLLNPTTRKIKKFAATKCDYRRWIFNYAESLVPVGGMKSSTNFL